MDRGVLSAGRVEADNQLTLNYGLRFDQMWQFVNTNQLSPRVNLVYRPWERSNIHAGYARYFTPPVQALAGPTNTSAFTNTTKQPEVLQNSPVLAGAIARVRRRCDPAVQRFSERP